MTFAPPTVPRQRSTRWANPLAVGTVALAGCVAVGLSTDGASYLPGCPFRALTGLDCPGCGMTRAARQVLRGHPLAAADFNLLMVLCLPLVAYAYVAWLSTALGRPLPLRQVGGRAAVVLLTVLVAFSVIRNLPVGVGRYLNSGG